MRYIKTVDMWDGEASQLVRAGELKLQRGQWIRCGTDNLSRFVRMLPCGTIHAAHWSGSGAARQERFVTLCKIGE